MLFFFEAGFFVLAVATVGVVEFVGRGAALAVWGGVTIISLLASPVVQRRIASTAAADLAETRFRRLLGESWRHLNKLLLIGFAVVAAWWALGALAAAGT